MKQELDNLTTEESLAHSPDIGSSGVKHNLSRISVSNLRREEILKYSLQEAEAKLQSLEQQKRMIRGTRQEHSEIGKTARKTGKEFRTHDKCDKKAKPAEN